MIKTIIKSILLLFCLHSFNPVGFSQKVWTLEQCVGYALENNPLMKQAEFDVETAQIDLKAQKLERLPFVSANSNAGIQFGRTIDPTTNSFDNQRIGYNGLGLNADMNVFAGGLFLKLKDQAMAQLNAFEHQQADMAMQIKLDVLGAYLNVLLAEEQLDISENDLENLNTQYAFVKKEVVVGTRSVTERLEIEAQIAQMEQLATQNRYQVELAKATLIQMMQLPLQEKIEVQKIDGALTPSVMEPQQVFDHVQTNHPRLLAQKAELNAAAFDIEIAKSRRLPRLSLFLSMNSSFSSAARQVVGFQQATDEQEVTFLGSTGTLSMTYDQPIFEDQPYWNQINENFGQQIGVSLNIPIFSQGQQTMNIQRAEVNIQRNQAIYEATRQELDFAVQQTFLEMEAAWANFEAAEKNVSVNNRLLTNKIKEFQVGTVPQLDYFTVLNQNRNARVQLVLAKYAYLFKAKQIGLLQDGVLTGF